MCENETIYPIFFVCHKIFDHWPNEHPFFASFCNLKEFSQPTTDINCEYFDSKKERKFDNRKN